MSNLDYSPQLNAWRLFLTLHAKIIEVIDKDLQNAGSLSLNHYDVLIELMEAEGKRLRLHELARLVVLSRSSITRLVDQLEQQGLLVRQPDPEDRRGAYAVLTAVGEQAVRDTWPLYKQAILQHFGRFLTDEAAEIIYQSFTQAHEALDT
jgi:DNA-binding MarR family transcriptional regulator